ncbi:MAG: hypothetical protein AB1758_04130 [Candidatus Eremiobacterota bacterium]
MRRFVLSILSLLCLIPVFGCGDKMSPPETFTLRGKPVEFACPPKTWTRKEHRETPAGVFDEKEANQLVAIEFRVPPEGKGYLIVTNLGVSDLLLSAATLKQLAADIRKVGPTDEMYRRLWRELDEAGATDRIFDKENPLRVTLEKAEKALKKKQAGQAVQALDEAVAMLEKVGKKKEIDIEETGPILNAIQKRDGKVIRQEESRVDGQRAAWVEFETPKERGLQVAFMKDDNLYSVSLNVPADQWSRASKVAEEVVKSLKVR